MVSVCLQVFSPALKAHLQPIFVFFGLQVSLSRGKLIFLEKSFSALYTKYIPCLLV